MKCKYCPKELSGKIEKHEVLHVLKYTPQSLYKCDACRLFFDNWRDEAQHERNSHQRPPAKRVHLASEETDSQSDLLDLIAPMDDVDESTSSPDEGNVEKLEDEAAIAAWPIFSGLPDISLDELEEMFEIENNDDITEGPDTQDSLDPSKKTQESIFANLEEFLLYIFYQQEGANRTSCRRMNLLLLLLADHRIKAERFPKSMKSKGFFSFSSAFFPCH